MLKAFRVSLLVLTLSCSVFAGDMPNGVQPDPTPTPTTKSIVEETDDSTVVQESQEFTLTTVEIQLSLMQLVLGLF